MSDMSVGPNALIRSADSTVHNEHKKDEQQDIISNMTNVSNAKPECELKLRRSDIQRIDNREGNFQRVSHEELNELVQEHKKRFVNILNDIISHINSNPPKA